ncbi:MAG: hypothetical protein JNK82_00825 [Myxococcaceae bacterium]|nr:hypothetical protein [Myxococcaceae bacterium]
MRSNLRSTVFSFAAPFVVVVIACGAPQNTPGEPCSGHGHLDVPTECHCDRGYESPAGDPLSCVPVGGGAGGTGATAGGTGATAGGSGATAGGTGATAGGSGATAGGSGATAGGSGATAGGSGATAGGSGAHEMVTVAPTMPEVRYFNEMGQGVWLYGAQTGAFVVSIESYAGYGAPSTPGTYTLQQIDSSYLTCAVCVIMKRGAERYMPVYTPGKTVTLSQLGTMQGQRFAGSVDALEFREVTIAANYTTTDVPNGRRLLVSAHAWDHALPAPECGGHGHTHGNTCHCDPGYGVDPANPMNCIPQ